MSANKRVTIIRAPKGVDNPYFQMLRTTAQNKSLSFEARGVLAYLLSKADNWELQPKDLMNEGHCGRDRINRIIKELKDHNYLKAEQTQDDDGKFERNVYTLYETPFTEKPLTVKPLTENPLHKEDREVQSTDKRKELSDTPSVVSAEPPQTIPPLKGLTIHQTMFQAVCDAWGYPVDLLTKSKRGQIGSVASELVGAHAQPPQIAAFKEWLDEKARTEKWGSYTVNAMKTYWPDFVAANPPAPEPGGEPGIDPLYDPSVEELTFEELNRRKLERSVRQLEALRQSS